MQRSEIFNSQHDAGTRWISFHVRTEFLNYHKLSLISNKLHCVWCDTQSNCIAFFIIFFVFICFCFYFLFQKMPLHNFISFYARPEFGIGAQLRTGIGSECTPSVCDVRFYCVKLLPNNDFSFRSHREWNEHTQCERKRANERVRNDNDNNHFWQ